MSFDTSRSDSPFFPSSYSRNEPTRNESSRNLWIPYPEIIRKGIASNEWEIILRWKNWKMRSLKPLKFLRKASFLFFQEGTRPYIAWKPNWNHGNIVKYLILSLTIFKRIDEYLEFLSLFNWFSLSTSVDSCKRRPSFYHFQEL